MGWVHHVKLAPELGMLEVSGLQQLAGHNLVNERSVTDLDLVEVWSGQVDNPYETDTQFKTIDMKMHMLMEIDMEIKQDFSTDGKWKFEASMTTRPQCKVQDGDRGHRLLTAAGISYAT